MELRSCTETVIIVWDCNPREFYVTNVTNCRQVSWVPSQGKAKGLLRMGM
jgi:hypothetical protein